MLETITIYAATIAPAITAFLGMILLFCKGISKVKGAAADITRRDEIVKLTEQNAELQRELARTNKTIRLLTDKIVKIQGYADFTLNDKED